MNFATLQGLTIPEGVVTQITDASGRVLWAVSGGKVILQVEKITNSTAAGETLYENEQFILLDIYPKTNGTVKVTYGGLTKTITDTSGAAEPNAQEVFFGTFNGVSDGVVTPASGELTIEGDFVAFGCGSYSISTTKDTGSICGCILGVIEWGKITFIPESAFGFCAKLTSVILPSTISAIKNSAFEQVGITTIKIPNRVTSIGTHAFNACSNLTSFEFENTSGWYVTQTEGATSGIVVDVTNPTSNVKLITETYHEWYWYRL